MENIEGVEKIVDWTDFAPLGYLAGNPEMKAIFLASGYGIHQGLRLAQIRNPDVASIIAALLGVRLPAAEGSVPPGLLTK